MKFLHLKAMDDKYGRPSLRIATVGKNTTKHLLVQSP